ncbi:zinc finger MYM-type protein 1-like [Linepithema humile]|uniref:zinc finger MYM-type protein 1-like n=1 Tax=Linepithema humile TaxID=83485 RepID=UPI00351E8F87
MERYIIRVRNNTDTAFENVEPRNDLSISINTKESRGKAACVSDSDCPEKQNMKENDTSAINCLQETKFSKTSDQNNNQDKDIPKAFKRWTKEFSWLNLNVDRKAICIICTQAIDLKLTLPFNTQSMNAKEAFVTKGYSNWKNAASRFKNHEKSDFHLSAVIGLNNLKKPTVIQHMSSAKQTEMVEAREALRKIFSTINFLVRQGLAFRGKTDESSNVLKLLQLRAEDVSILKKWLGQTKFKWTHKDSINEILHLMAKEILNKQLAKIKKAKYFSIIIDETSDITRFEQVSFSIRIVLDDMTIEEIFMGFYETPSTTAEILFNIVKDILARFDLDIHNLRGQCYDGAANVSGRITGLQARIKESEPRALYVHCNAHNLNLVVQDGMQCISSVKNFIGVVKELINFIRDSPKRQGHFKELQSDISPALTQFCPTR